MNEQLRKHACPRCGRPAEQCGTVGGPEADGQEHAVFQCEECQSAFEMEGETFPCAFTFAVDAAGRAYDPTADVASN